jgi:imidazole glycerol-phosphate synthase subunit HisH
MITIINYGMGNLGSVLNMFKRIGVQSKISTDIKEIEQAEKLLLPGVGAFDAAMELINNSGLLPVLNYKATEEKTPVLGICLGMQLLTNGSDEGTLSGLKWVDAFTKKFEFADNSMKVPHMGWNFIQPTNKSPLMHELNKDSKFYFVHSYYVECKDEKDVLAATQYGSSFHSIIQHDNIYGAQFHPEKSHKYGMQLLANFSKI